MPGALFSKRQRLHDGSRLCHVTGIYEENTSPAVFSRVTFADFPIKIELDRRAYLGGHDRRPNGQRRHCWIAFGRKPAPSLRIMLSGKPAQRLLAKGKASNKIGPIFLPSLSGGVDGADRSLAMVTLGQPFWRRLRSHLLLIAIAPGKVAVASSPEPSQRSEFL
jgi:hypothetical protein